MTDRTMGALCYWHGAARHTVWLCRAYGVAGGSVPFILPTPMTTKTYKGGGKFINVYLKVHRNLWVSSRRHPFFILDV